MAAAQPSVSMVADGLCFSVDGVLPEVTEMGDGCRPKHTHNDTTTRNCCIASAGSDEQEELLHS